MIDKQDTSKFYTPDRPRRTIRQRLIWGNVAIGMLLLLASVIVIWQVNRLSEAVGLLQTARERATTALQVHQDSTQLIAIISRLLPVEDAAVFETEVASALDALRESHAKLVVLAAEANEDEMAYPLLSRVSRGIDNIIGLAETMVRQASAGQWHSVRVRVGVLTRDHQQLATEIDRLVELAKEIEEAAAAQVAFARQATVLYPALAAGLSIVLAALLAWRITRSIAQPVERLTEGAAQLAAGFLDRRVVVGSADELGQLAAAFNQMAERLQASHARLEQRVAERTAELRESEAQKRALLNAIPDLMLQISKDGVFLNYQAVSEEDLAMPPSEFLHKNIAEVFPTEFAERTMYYVRQALQSDNIQVFEFRMPPPRDDDRHFEARIAASGTDEALIIVRNITERKHAEIERERLLAAEREQRLLAETLAEVTLALTAQIGHEAVLDEILRQAQRIVPSSTANIALLNQGTLHTARWQGYRAFDGEEFISGLVQPLTEFSLDAQVVRSRKPLAIPDTRQEPRWVMIDDVAWIRSYLAVPICLRDRVLGLLRLDSDTPGEFSIKDAQRLQPLANAAAIALENARLFAATRRQADQLEALRQVSQDLAALRDLDTLLRHIVEQAIQLLAADAGGMYLYRPERQVLEWVVAVGENMAPAGTTLGRGEGLSGKVWDTGEPLIVDDYDNWDGKTSEWSPVTGSVIGLPIQWGDKFLGVLNILADNAQRRFTAEDMALLSQLAAQAAIVIQNAQLYEEERASRERAEALRQAAQAMGTSLELDEILRLILAQLRRVLVYDTASVLILREGNVPDLVVGVGYANEAMTSQQSSRLLQDSPILRQMVRDLQPVVSVDVRQLDGWIWVPGAEHVRSWLGVPLVSRGQMVGALMADSVRLDFFGPEEVEIAQALAQHAAQAIENARLFEDLQRYATDLELRVEERTAELRDQKAGTEAILDAAGEGIVVTNRDGAIVYMNPAASRLTGYSLAEASTDTPRLWKSGQHPPEFYEHMWQTILAGRVWRGDVVNRRKDGTLFDAALTIAPIPDDEGQPIGFVGIQNDISHLKELDRLKSKFVSDVSHELRTPVTNIILYLSLLERTKPDDPTHYLAVLREQSSRLARLIEDILSLSRLDLGKKKVALAPVNLNRVVEQVVATHQPRAEAAGLRLIFEPEATLPPVQAERNQLAQVVINLIDNALNYTSVGQVRVSTHLAAAEKQACLQVQDTGMGIESEDLPHLFDRFYRGQRVGSSNIPGTGLGLAIVQEIVDLHGGKIEVESKVDRGSTFKVWLPLAVNEWPNRPAFAESSAGQVRARVRDAS